MTTPDTADVRRWAIANGISVATRGRLPADIHLAYLAAQEGAAPTAGRSSSNAKAVGRVAGVKPTSPRPSPAKLPAVQKPSAPTGPGRSAAGTSMPDGTDTAASNAWPTQSQPTSRTEPVSRPQPTERPRPLSRPESVTRPQLSDRAERETPTASETEAHITALQQQVAALVDRVSALEKSLGAAASTGSSDAGSKSSLFRRRKG